jgi:aspartate 1-decarboxylase
MKDKKKVAKIVDKKINTRSANMIDNTQREGETLGSVGPFVKVTWNDAASTFKTYVINADNPSEHLTVCETVGEMVAKDDKAIVVVMHGSQCDGCDIMAIPTDWAQKIEILETVGECIETSESQQESQNQKPEKN